MLIASGTTEMSKFLAAPFNNVDELDGPEKSLRAHGVELSHIRWCGDVLLSRQ